ncbi:Ribonuclease/ribotoxin [Cladorrhinum sp. PSN259]|nr:Ribonuclease/ribotoxin [Cladorrhinum sp. PSN259]
MVGFKAFLVAALYAAAAVTAQGTTSISSVSCGSKSYTKQQVDEAVAEGCRLYAAGQQLGNSKYPHKYNNFENLVFAASGPYQEFPIVSGGAYSGGSPGADRVVFSPSYQGSCVYVGAMTHTGASGNSFLSCSEKSAGRPGTGSSASTTTTTTPTTSSVTRSAASATGPPKSSSTAGPDSGAGRKMMGLGGQGLALGLMAWAFVL